MTDDPFLQWLAEQDYYVSHRTVEESWPDADFRPMNGITTIPGWSRDDVDDDDTLVPRRDYRRHYVRGSATNDE